MAVTTRFVGLCWRARTPTSGRTPTRQCQTPTRQGRTPTRLYGIGRNADQTPLPTLAQRWSGHRRCARRRRRGAAPVGRGLQEGRPAAPASARTSGPAQIAPLPGRRGRCHAAGRSGCAPGVERDGRWPRTSGGPGGSCPHGSPDAARRGPVPPPRPAPSGHRRARPLAEPAQGAGRRGPALTSATYSLSTPWEGWVSSWARAPSLVRINRPSVSRSSRPTGKTRGSAGTRSSTVGRPWVSDAVVMTSAGLFKR